MRSLLLLALMLCGAPALAQSPAADAAPAPADAAPAETAPADAAAGYERTGFEIGITAFGFVNGSFIDEPAEEDKFADIDGTPVRVPYSGFGGVGGGGGLGVSASWMGIVGLELQLVRSFDGGKGNVSVDGVDFEFDMGQMAWHVPLLFRVGVPAGVARPFLFGGPEWVFPESATFDFSSADTRDDWDAVADDYMVWAFGLGLDFAIPAGRDEVRIPLIIKGAYNTNLGPTAGDRVVLGDCTVSGAGAVCGSQAYVSEWQWQAFVGLGVSYVFLL